MPRRRSDFDAFCQTAFDFLEGAGVRYLVIGAVALLAVGEPRTTADVDVLAFFPAEAGQRLIDQAIRAGFDTNSEVEAERLARTGTLRFRRPPCQLDVILASLPFEESAYARSTEHEIFGRRVRFPSPEDLILFKILAAREKDLLDAMISHRMGLLVTTGRRSDTRDVGGPVHG